MKNTWGPLMIQPNQTALNTRHITHSEKHARLPQLVRVAGSFYAFRLLKLAMLFKRLTSAFGLPDNIGTWVQLIHAYLWEKQTKTKSDLTNGSCDQATHYIWWVSFLREPLLHVGEWIWRGFVEEYKSIISQRNLSAVAWLFFPDLSFKQATTIWRGTGWLINKNKVI